MKALGYIIDIGAAASLAWMAYLKLWIGESMSPVDWLLVGYVVGVTVTVFTTPGDSKEARLG